MQHLSGLRESNWVHGHARIHFRRTQQDPKRWSNYGRLTYGQCRRGHKKNAYQVEIWRWDLDHRRNGKEPAQFTQSCQSKEKDQTEGARNCFAKFRKCTVMGGLCPTEIRIRAGQKRHQDFECRGQGKQSRSFHPRIKSRLQR